MMQAIERLINFLAAIVTLASTSVSFYGTFNNVEALSINSAPLSFLRHLGIAVIILTSNYVIGTLCSKVYKGTKNQGSRSYLYGVLIVLAAWTSIYFLKYHLFLEQFCSGTKMFFWYIALVFASWRSLIFFTKAGSKDFSENDNDIAEFENVLTPIYLLLLIASFIPEFF